MGIAGDDTRLIRLHLVRSAGVCAEASFAPLIDTTLKHILTEEEWLYLAGYKDIFTGEIAGDAISEG